MMEKKTILLVDPDPESTMTLFAALVKAGFSVTDTPRSDYALDIIAKRSFHVGIVDVLASKSGDVDLIPLLRSSWTNPLIIAMADFNALAVKKAVIGRGANHFINKPVDVKHLLSLISPKPQKFSGQIEGVDILEYLQFMLLTGSRTIVRLESPESPACLLFLEGGNVVHATSGAVEGEQALFECLRLSGGSFTNLPWNEPPRRTISKPGEFMLLEAARIRDEG